MTYYLRWKWSDPVSVVFWLWFYSFRWCHAQHISFQIFTHHFNANETSFHFIKLSLLILFWTDETIMSVHSGIVCLMVCFFHANKSMWLNYPFSWILINKSNTTKHVKAVWKLRYSSHSGHWHCQSNARIVANIISIMSQMSFMKGKL